MTPGFAKSLSELLKDLNVSEAHVPQIWIEGVMNIPAQVLVVSDPRHGMDPEPFGRVIRAKIAGLLPSGMHLDIIFLTGGEELLELVRKADCSLL